jgi:hypothetical protein
MTPAAARKKLASLPIRPADLSRAWNAWQFLSFPTVRNGFTKLSSMDIARKP